MLFNFAWEYAIGKVQLNEGLKLNVTHQLMVYADYIIYSVKACTKALLVASNYISLEQNSEEN